LMEVKHGKTWMHRETY